MRLRSCARWRTAGCTIPITPRRSIRAEDWAGSHTDKEAAVAVSFDVSDCPGEGPWVEPLVDPVVEYSRLDVGAVVVGAQLYRGTTLPELRGRMILADWAMDWAQGENGALCVAAPGNGIDAPWTMRQIEIVSSIEGAVPGTTNRFIMTIGRDAGHELYVLTNEAMGAEPGRGGLYRLVPEPM